MLLSYSGQQWKRQIIILNTILRILSTPLLEVRKRILRPKKFQLTSRAIKPAERNSERVLAYQTSRNLNWLNNRITWSPSLFLPPPEDEEMEDSTIRGDRYGMSGARYLQAKKKEYNLKKKITEFTTLPSLGIIRKRHLFYLGRKWLLKSKVIVLSQRKPSLSRWEKVKNRFRLGHFLRPRFFFLCSNV